MNKPITSDGTVGKALSVLDLVAEFGRPVRFSEVLEKSPHPKATLYRFLQTLTSQGMLTYNSRSQTYSLGLRLVRLAHSAWEQSSLATVASPYLDRLAAEVGETIHLAQMESGQVLFVDKKRQSDTFETLARAGRVAPAHCTGVGKAILAFLPEAQLQRAMRYQAFVPFTANTHTSAESLYAELKTIRRDGVAYDRQEHETGIISIAMPILLKNGLPLGAVSVASSTSRLDLARLDAFQPMLSEAVRKIGEEAEAWNFPTIG